MYDSGLRVYGFIVEIVWGPGFRSSGSGVSGHEMSKVKRSYRDHSAVLRTHKP